MTTCNKKKGTQNGVAEVGGLVLPPTSAHKHLLMFEGTQLAIFSILKIEYHNKSQEL